MHIEKAKGIGILPGSRKNNKRYEKKTFGLNTKLWIWKLFHYIKKELALIILTPGECYTGKEPEVNLSNKVRCVNTVPSSSTETLRMMTGLEYAGSIKGKLDGTAYPQGTGTEYPPDRLGLAHSS